MYLHTCVLMYWVVIMWLGYPSSYNLTSSIVLTSSCSSRRSRFSNWYTSITRSVILFPPSLSLTLKILLTFRSFIRGVVSFYLICCFPSLMPPSVASVYYAVLVALILSISEVMPSYSYCVKKGLVCVVIVSLSSY